MCVCVCIVWKLVGTIDRSALLWELFKVIDDLTFKSLHITLVFQAEGKGGCGLTSALFKYD